jgi:CubicO group peptidase (beta-lactamase class C family)
MKLPDMKKATTLIAGMLLAIITTAQAIPEKMEGLAKAYAENGKFNGVLLVTQKGKVIYTGALGYKDAVNKIPHEAADIFQIGSITKQITAAVIMQLQEEKKLSVTDKLSSYFPDLPNSDKITIEHLLTHTSGLYNYTKDPKVMKADVTRHYSSAEMLAVFKEYKPDFEPGEKWNYSNTAYSVLGYIIEKVTGKPYERVVRERIFAPLGMTQSGFDFTHLASPAKSKGYFSLAGSTPVAAPVVDSTIAYSAGAVYSTVTDLAKWERAVTEGRLLKPESWKKVFTPQKNKYGYGWTIDTAFGRAFTAHSGGIHGFSSYLMRFPQDELAIIILDNASSSQLSKISTGLAAIVYNQPYEVPAKRKEIPLPKEVLSKYVGEYQLTPEFSIKVTLEGDELKAQASGQPQFAIYAERENFFFLKVVDAQLEFIKDEKGTVTKTEHYEK